MNKRFTLQNPLSIIKTINYKPFINNVFILIYTNLVLIINIGNYTWGE